MSRPFARSPLPFARSPLPFARSPLPGARRLALVLALLGSLPGFALLEPVAAWEKGMLAKPEMTFEGDRLDALFQEHTYSSKEAASGGAGVGGGGCGCN